MVTLRAATAGDAPFLEQMLLEAAAWSPDRPRPALHEVLATPPLAHYVAGWPQADDFGVVAVGDHDHLLGAAWCRRFTPDDPGYGFVADDVPEVSLAVVAEARGRGVGTQLLDAVAEEGRRRGIRALSLSVERANPAARLYGRVGYRTVAEDENALTMICEL